MIKDKELKDWEASGVYINSNKGNGLKIFAKEVGISSASSDKTLLLLHGFPESSFSYHLVLNGLLKHFERIVLFDFPGYGFSDKPIKGYSYSLLEQADIALEVWKHFGIVGGHLLAHDMGNSVATELVAREVEKSLPNTFSDGFKSYTFTNGSVVLELADLRIMQKLLLTKLGKYLAKISTKWIFRHQVRSAHGDSPLDEKEIKRLWDMTTYNKGKRVTYLTIKYIFDRRKYEAKRWLPALKNTEIPVHICWGDKDEVAKVEIAYYLKEKVCPNAQLTIMKGVGHFGQLGLPSIWLDSVLSFYHG
ncbi:alpha/beta fold hydrolase [Tenacibaculum xiamenense]|uniref:alpha/beta fold hydrolase n=1 Tax=Tenacibaculum xiamenense TaxID=1261553 RepID=UPI0038948730